MIITTSSPKHEIAGPLMVASQGVRQSAVLESKILDLPALILRTKETVRMVSANNWAVPFHEKANFKALSILIKEPLNLPPEALKILDPEDSLLHCQLASSLFQPTEDPLKDTLAKSLLSGMSLDLHSLIQSYVGITYESLYKCIDAAEKVMVKLGPLKSSTGLYHAALKCYEEAYDIMAEEIAKGNFNPFYDKDYNERTLLELSKRYTKFQDASFDYLENADISRFCEILYECDLQANKAEKDKPYHLRRHWSLLKEALNNSYRPIQISSFLHRQNPHEKILNKERGEILEVIFDSSFVMIDLNHHEMQFLCCEDKVSLSQKARVFARSLRIDNQPTVKDCQESIPEDFFRYFVGDIQPHTILFNDTNFKSPFVIRILKHIKKEIFCNYCRKMNILEAITNSILNCVDREQAIQVVIEHTPYSEADLKKAILGVEASWKKTPLQIHQDAPPAEAKTHSHDFIFPDTLSPLKDILNTTFVTPLCPCFSCEELDYLGLFGRVKLDEYGINFIHTNSDLKTGWRYLTLTLTSIGPDNIPSKDLYFLIEALEPVKILYFLRENSRIFIDHNLKNNRFANAILKAMSFTESSKRKFLKKLGFDMDLSSKKILCIKIIANSILCCQNQDAALDYVVNEFGFSREEIRRALSAQQALNKAAEELRAWIEKQRAKSKAL